MPAPSLFELARKECIKQVRCMFNPLTLVVSISLNFPTAVTHVGTLEYEKVRPLLMKLDNPEQLVGRMAAPPTSQVTILTARRAERYREVVTPNLRA